MKYAIGIDIGGTKIAAGIVNEKGDLIQKEVVKSDPSDKENMFNQVMACVKLLLNHSSIPLQEIYGVGVGIPGKVDIQKGVAVFQNNLPWRNFPIVERLKQELNISNIVIDNDVYMAAFAEWKHTNLGEKDLLVYCTVSTGIACSTIQGGKFIRGAGFAGELGLVPVYTPRKESHLNRLELIASGPALEKHAIAVYDNDSMSTEDLFSLYTDGDDKAITLLDEFAASLAHGVYMITSLLDPHLIVFGGSVITHNPFVINLVREKLATLIIEEQNHSLLDMTVSNLGNDQGVIGAGLRVMDLS